MSTETIRRPFTVADYMRMGEAGILGRRDRVELIHGEILAMSPIGPPHNAAVARALREFIQVFGDEAIVWAQGSVQLDNWSAPEPDIALLRARDDFYASRLPLPQDILLVVEISETSLRYDRDTKAELYAAAGIPEYWVSDIGGDRVYVYSNPEGGAYGRVGEFHRGSRIPPQLFPESSIAIDALLA